MLSYSQAKRSAVQYPSANLEQPVPGRVGRRVAGRPGLGSVEATTPQVFGDDDIRHSVKDKLDVVGVSGAGDVGIDLLVGRLVLAFVLGLDVGHGFREGAGACGRDREGNR